MRKGSLQITATNKHTPKTFWLREKVSIMVRDSKGISLMGKKGGFCKANNEMRSQGITAGYMENA